MTQKWHYSTCRRDLSLSVSAVCESCLNWYHLSCVGLTAVPKKAMWFYRFCYGNQAEAVKITDVKVTIMNK